MLNFNIILQKKSINLNINYPTSHPGLQFKYYWPNFKPLQWNKYYFSIPLQIPIFLKVVSIKVIALRLCGFYLNLEIHLS